MLINPFGGLGKGLDMWDTVVEPMMRRAGVTYDVISTERAHHATEIAASLDLDKHSAVAIISGDGLMHEVINGLMQHKDWQRAVKHPIGVIPGGTGNGLCVSMGIRGANVSPTRNSHHRRHMRRRAEHHQVQPAAAGPDGESAGRHADPLRVPQSGLGRLR